ncbi:CCA tRNA nucleotidyltransferase [Candidatus Woesearchaeota archaeon]|nr:CCA tRNA nucleotidyltransferase [Candidatus Woesearchaeota archaeon]
MDNKFSFLEKIKEEITPDKSVLKKVDYFVKEINNQIKRNKIKAVCVKGGSVAKGTFIKNDYDIDLFVKFNYSYNNQDLSLLLKKILSGFKKLDLVHGSRDYFQIKHQNLNCELVPVLDIKEPGKALNVTDMSPMHVDWVKKNIKNKQEDEIRLTKKFCKAQGIYGAESYINGFSGHVIDILIIFYGSFLELLKNSVKWKQKVIIDINSYYKNKKILFELNKSKTHGPLIVVDPVFPDRNAAAALSLEKFNLFKKKAKEFLKNPSEEFFVRERVDLESLKKRARKNKLIFLDVIPVKGKEDVTGSKLLKAHKYIEEELKKNDFKLIDSGWDWDKKNKAVFWYIAGKENLPEYKEITGPPTKITEHCKVFKEKYSDCSVKNGKLYAKIKREYKTPEKLIRNLIGDSDYLKEKVKKIKI